MQHTLRDNASCNATLTEQRFVSRIKFCLYQSTFKSQLHTGDRVRGIDENRFVFARISDNVIIQFLSGIYGKPLSFTETKGGNDSAVS